MKFEVICDVVSKNLEPSFEPSFEPSLDSPVPLPPRPVRTWKPRRVKPQDLRTDRDICDWCGGLVHIGGQILDSSREIWSCCSQRCCQESEAYFEARDV